MSANAFMDDAALAAMEQQVGVSSDDGPKEAETETVETATDVDSSTTDTDVEESPEEGETDADAEVGATDVKEEAPSGWVPRSRLNDLSDRLRANEDEFKAFREAQATSVAAQPATESKARSEIDTLISELWPDESTAPAGNEKLLEAFIGLRSEVADMKQARVDTQVKQIQDGWTKEIEETNAHFKKEHGIEIPPEMVMNGVIASQGSKSPHQIMEEYLQWHVGLSKKEAKEIVKDAVDATPAASRKGKGKRSPSQSSKQRKVPETIEEMGAAAAASLGVEW